MSQFVLALIMGSFIGAAAGYLGTLMLSKRMVLVAGPLGHLTLPGIALAFLFGFDVSLGAFMAVSLGIILIWLLEIKTKLPMEALTAIVFATGVAITFLFLPEEKTIPALIGDISQISPIIVTITVILSLSVIFVIKKIYKKIVLAEISEDIAKSEGINVKKYNFIYLFCIAIVVSLGAKVVGGLMTAALVAIPACTSKNLSKNIFQYCLGGLFFGGLSCLIGIILFKFTNIPAGPLIVLSSAFFFLISLIFSAKGGKR
ncbi:MAG: ABC transporter [Candidatus Tagabacteria bacterium CG09_land_8_20_14_0_10_41_14]|uniref:ABC transporter n=2 Tax=Candidatus Tagaibacteriota TaxID=1817918 RepID=A0A2H0WLH2_9BACT|nr:MAG: ABC transporter [Candidatus Tagabacteria bacterium CG09_land_8_20_14_0_10_41_14]PJE73045.1 MAG: ABC transporter [Candidatus Tagabacteria bacterium CG10_big_fil_rev_8_21_14_0_10_40_13]